MQTAFAADNNAAIPDCGIAVMAKASLPGRTKTRLVPPLTFDEAARCNTAFLRDIADNILAAAARSSIAGYMAFGPPDAKSFFQECLPDEIGLIEGLARHRARSIPARAGRGCTREATPVRRGPIMRVLRERLLQG